MNSLSMLSVVCQSLGSRLNCHGVFLISQRISNALCVMWDQKRHAEEVVLKTNNFLLGRKTSAGWFQTICSSSSSAEGICLWLEVEFIQLCSLSCHSYRWTWAKESNPSPEGISHSKTCEPWNLWTLFLKRFFDALSSVLSKRSEQRISGKNESDPRSRGQFRQQEHSPLWNHSTQDNMACIQEAQEAFSAMTYHGQTFGFFLTCPRTLSREKYCQVSYSLAVPKTTGNQLSQPAQLIKNCEYQCSFPKT